MLDALGAAEKRLLEQPEQLPHYHYSTLLLWAEAFENANRSAATTLCYRTLLDEILNKGRTNAYRHAARYYRKLVRLASRSADEALDLSALEFDARLRATHGCKRSFWVLISAQK